MENLQKLEAFYGKVFTIYLYIQQVTNQIKSMENKFNLPTEMVELPSKGLPYPITSPLSEGKLEMKYMTAKEEDILTNTNYIKQGVVIDKLLQSLIVTPIDYNDLLVGDKEAIMIAARILSYGKDYEVQHEGKPVIVDLTTLQNKEIDVTIFTKGKNEFSFTLPHTKNVVTFKLLTHADDKAIDQEVKGLLKINKDNITEVTTRFKRMITSVNGMREVKDIREFVDKYLLAIDARALREEYSRISPSMDLTFKYTNENDEEEDVNLPIGITFFWPDAK